MPDISWLLAPYLHMGSTVSRLLSLGKHNHKHPDGNFDIKTQATGEHEECVKRGGEK